LQGNIICLLDPQRCEVAETYRYCAFGEEKIFNERGRVVTDSSAGNPWRYRGKRVDKESGLMYFGYRYYDPAVGRWISPDPAGAIDGPNLYAYARNNPMKYVDYFGLNSMLDDNCRCTQHDHPGWHNAPEGCVCICGKNGTPYSSQSYRGKMGSDIKSALYGVSHGVVDFMVGSLHDLQTAATYMGAAELDSSFQERIQIIEAVEQSQAYQMSKVESFIMDKLSIDKSDTVYQSFRSTTTLGLEVGSLVAGGYGAVKGVVAFTKLARAPQQVATVAKLSVKTMNGGGGFLGHKGFELKNASFQYVRNKPVNIQGRAYSGHALDQMQNRGFNPSVIEETIQNGASIPNKVVGRMQFYDPENNISVITEEGKVVTVMYGRVK